MREVSIANRKLDEFKKEIELSKKTFKKHAKILDTSFDFKERKIAVKAPLSVNNCKTAETSHQKVLQPVKCSTIQMSDEKNDYDVHDCAIQKLKLPNTTCTDKSEMVNMLQYVQSKNRQTVYREKENFSESSHSAKNLPLLLKCPSISVEVPNSVNKIPKSGDLMSDSLSVSRTVNCMNKPDTVPEEIMNYKRDSLKCKLPSPKHICKSDVNNVDQIQVLMKQQDNESLEVSIYNEIKDSVENEPNLSTQPDVKVNKDGTMQLISDTHEVNADVKMSKYGTMEFIKDTYEVNSAEIEVTESEISSKQDKSLGDHGGEQCINFESGTETAMRNSSKKGLAGVFVSTLIRQKTQINYKKNTLKGNQKEGTSLSVTEKPGNGKDGSHAVILRKYWLLWKDHTFSEIQKTKVDRLLSALEEFKKNEQPEQHVEQRAGCHSAGPVLQSQNIQNSREDLCNMADYKRKNIRKSIRCQSMPAKSNITCSQVNKRRGREKNRKQQDIIDDIENKARELSAERQKREAALAQEKEEMHIIPYGKVPFWVLQPTRLIATETIRRAQERKEAIQLRLETKRLREEQQAAAERMRLEAETERVRRLHELARAQYQQKISRRLLLDPLRALVAESHQKQAQASAFACHLLLRKYWRAWRQITFEKMSALTEVVCRVRMRRAFQALLEIKTDAKRQHQVAEDFYDVWILKRQAFVRWRSYVKEQSTQEATVMQMALQHYYRTLLCHYFRQWYKVRYEKQRRERLEVWRIRVREVLPDFMPPETN